MLQFNEEKRVSIQVKNILSHAHKMFKLHMDCDQHEEAISVGDEYLEWIKDLDSEEIFYYNQNDLNELYLDLKRKRRRGKRK
jgi:hypothetical protein